MKSTSLLSSFRSESHKSKKRQISSGDGSENDQDESSSASDNDEKKKKSKHSKKSKKKEKHRRKKQADDDEQEWQPLVLPDEEPPESKALQQSTSTNSDEKISRYENSTRFQFIHFHSFRSNSYRSATKVDSNGRPVKGRGIMVCSLFGLFFVCHVIMHVFRDIRAKVVRDLEHHLIGVRLQKNVNVLWK